MQDPKEIFSLNSGLVNFDVNDITVEELERRLELAVGVLNGIDTGGGSDCPCPFLKTCGTFCNPSAQ